MSKYFNFLIFLFYISQVMSQEQNVKIDYDLYITGFSMSKKSSELFVADNYSVFVWNDTLSKVEENESEENVLKFTIELSDSIGTINYYSKKKDSILTRSAGLDEILIVKEKRTAIAWELHQETKTIGQFECNKASCSFRGRSYEVWYTPEIPIFYGPWKLHGLPGLVMEVKDKEGMLQAYFTKLSRTDKDLTPYLNIFKTDKIISLKEYAAKKSKLVDELVKKLKLSFPRELNMSIDGIKQDQLEREFN